jgi:hypothetical protein
MVPGALAHASAVGQAPSAEQVTVRVEQSPNAAWTWPHVEVAPSAH